MRLVGRPEPGSGTGFAHLGWVRRVSAMLMTLLLMAMVSGLALSGCSDDQPESSGEDPAATGGEAVEAALGEEAALNGVVVLVSSLVSTLSPTLPESTLQSGAQPPPPGGVFYQARLLVTNGSDRAAWLDPADFTLVAGDQTLYVDPTRSGPRPRALLPTASLGMILTFPGPEDIEGPVLEFRPYWYGAGLKVVGEARQETATTAAAD